MLYVVYMLMPGAYACLRSGKSLESETQRLPASPPISVQQLLGEILGAACLGGGGEGRREGWKRQK